MDIFLSLLRTLVFVLATVAATVYVGRRIGRGRPLLWTGTTVLVLNWLALFGWTTYLAGATDPSPDLELWITWSGYLLPFFAGLAYIWAIGQAAGFPSRKGAEAGAQLGRVTPQGASAPAGTDAATPGAPAAPPGGSGAPSKPVAAAAGATTATAAAAAAGGAHPVPPPAEHHHKHKSASAGLGLPHAVPVVTVPSASHHSPVDPDPVADLGRKHEPNQEGQPSAEKPAGQTQSEWRQKPGPEDADGDRDPKTTG